MNTATQPIFVLLVLMALCQSGCRSTIHSASQDGGGASSENSPIPHVFVEVDRHGNRFTNALFRIDEVDAHSQLVVEFPKSAEPSAGANALINPAWKDLHGVMELLNQRAAEWRRLNAQVIAPGDTNGLQKVQRETEVMAGKAQELIDDLEALGVRGERLNAVLSGRALGYTNRTRTPYLNLAEWATNHWSELKGQYEQLQREVETNSKVNITVQAVRESVTGKRSLLHIPQWDTLPEGVYSPIDRTGLRPTAAERERLDAARAAAEAGARLINSAISNRAGLRAAFQNQLEEWKDTVESVQIRLESVTSGWEPSYAQVMTNLDAIATTPELQAPALTIKSNLTAIAEIFHSVEQDIAAARKIRAGISGGSVDPVELLLGQGGFLATADSFIADCRRIAVQVQGIPASLSRIREQMAPLPATLRDRLESLLQGEFADALAEFQSKFPESARQAETLWVLLRGSLDATAAAATLADADGRLISRPSDDLIPARLDLKRAGLSLGDTVTVTVQATNATSGTSFEPESYETEIGLIGLHGKPSVHLIVARALSGPEEATSWKASVAAGVEWHYTYRRPEAPLSKTWNWLYPGVGIHVASLDQGSDSFEIGTGGTVSLKDGLLSAGLGYNFSIKREYLWIGVDMLTLLNEVKQGVMKNQD